MHHHGRLHHKYWLTVHRSLYDAIYNWSLNYKTRSWTAFRRCALTNVIAIETYSWFFYLRKNSKIPWFCHPFFGKSCFDRTNIVPLLAMAVQWVPHDPNDLWCNEPPDFSRIDHNICTTIDSSRSSGTFVGPYFFDQHEHNHFGRLVWSSWLGGAIENYVYWRRWPFLAFERSTLRLEPMFGLHDLCGYWENWLECWTNWFVIFFTKFFFHLHKCHANLLRSFGSENNLWPLFCHFSCVYFQLLVRRLLSATENGASVVL